MRHRKAGRKFGRNPAQRQALLRQLAISMILHERLTTTEAKAKSLRPVVEKLVTIAREDTPHHRNLVMSKIDHPAATTKLFEVVAPRFEGTPGGYTRISKLGNRHGDAAPMALIEFIEL
jgi:large subunit ribosomal protein L17